MYRAEFHFNRKTIFLGMYSSATEAARAFDRAALAKIGPHAKIKFHLSNYTEEGGTNTVSLLGVKRVKESLQISTGNAASKKSLDQKAINGHYTAAALGEHGQKHNPKLYQKEKENPQDARIPRIVKHSSPYPFHKLTIPPNLLGKCVHITECFAIFHRIFDFPRVDLMSLVSALFLHSVNDKNKTVKCINEDEKLCQSSNANVDYDAHILAQMHILLLRAVFNGQSDDSIGLFSEKIKDLHSKKGTKTSRFWLLKTAMNEEHNIRVIYTAKLVFTMTQ